MAQGFTQGFSKFHRFIVAAGLAITIVLLALWNPIRVKEAGAADDFYGSFASQFYAAEQYNPPQEMPLVSFAGPESKVYRWEDFEGQYTLVNFWASWCAPCLVELPSLETLAFQYPNKLRVIAVSVDNNRSQSWVEQFVKGRKLGEFAAYYDNAEQIRRNVSMAFLPASYILNPQGDLVYVFKGDNDWRSPETTAFFDALLAVNR